LYDFLSGVTDLGYGVDFEASASVILTPIIKFSTSGKNVSGFTFKPMITVANVSKEYTPYAKTNLQLTNEVKGLIDTAAYNGAKNLLPMTLEGIKALNTVGTWNGNAYTYRGVTFTVNTDNLGNFKGIDVIGEASSTTIFFCSHIPLILNNNYILNGCPKGGNIDTKYKLQWYTDNYSVDVVDTGSGVLLSNYPTDIINSRIRIVVYPNNVISSPITFYPMIRLASDTDSTFQPYAKTNLELTDDVRDIDYRLEGNACTNLFNINTITVGLINDDGTWNSSQTTWRTSDFIEVKSGVNITFKGLINSTKFNYLSISEYTSNKTFIQRTVLQTDTLTLTLEANTKYVRVGYREEFTNLILSYNPNATYEPYYPSNKELASTRPELKSGTFTVSLNSKGYGKFSPTLNGVIPVYYSSPDGNVHSFIEYSNNDIGISVISADSHSYITSTSISGTLYYYEL
jgi:hypothetical protein